MVVSQPFASYLMPKDGNLVSFWVDESKVGSITNPPSILLIKAGFPKAIHSLCIEEASGSGDSFGDEHSAAPLSFRLAGHPYGNTVLSATHPQLNAARSSTASTHVSTPIPDVQQSRMASPNGAREDGTSPPRSSSSSAFQRISSLPYPVPSTLSLHPHRKAISQDFSSFPGHPTAYVPSIKELADFSRSISEQSISSCAPSITLTVAFQRNSMLHSLASGYPRHPFTYSPNVCSSTSNPGYSSKRSSLSSSITIEPRRSDVTEKELRRRRLIKLTRTLGEDIPPELVIGRFTYRDDIRTLEHTKNGQPDGGLLDQNHYLPSTRHKKSSNSVSFPTLPSHTESASTLKRRDSEKRVGWGVGPSLGLISLARGFRPQRQQQKEMQARHSQYDDPEKRHSIVKAGTLLYRRPVLVPADVHNRPGGGAGSLMGVMIDRTDCKDVVAYFEDHPFRGIGSEGSTVHPSASMTISESRGNPAVLSLPITPPIPTTPLLHRTVANLRPPPSTPSSSHHPPSIRLRDSSRIHREEIPWMRHSMSLSPSLPSLGTLGSILNQKHVDDAAPFSDYSPSASLANTDCKACHSSSTTSPSQSISSASLTKSEDKAKASPKTVRIDVPFRRELVKDGDTLECPMGRPSITLEVERETYLDLSHDEDTSRDVSSVSNHCTGAQTFVTEPRGAETLSTEAKPISDVPVITKEEGEASSVERPHILRSESAMSGVYRSEKRQGWSGEWNQPHILDVIEKLRIL